MNYEFTRLKRRVEELEKRMEQLEKMLAEKKKPGPKPKVQTNG
jgi:prefoldin subunit 5